jgi:dolichol-phosphate mannosyltransferase
VTLSFLTPAFNEAANLPALYERIAAVMRGLGLEWDWLVVDDHSRDDTLAVVERLAARDPRVRGLRLARNGGSHAAIRCGLHHVRGDAVVVLAADLQDPPEVVSEMLDRWRRGAQVVWATRRARPGERSHAGFAAVYYWIMRRVVGLTGMPARGADCVLADRAVVDAFKRFPERNVSVLALLTWIGFRQEVVEYDKQPRAAGRSGWTLSRKLTLVADSITAFSDLPLRLLLYGGAAMAALGVLLAAASPWVPGGIARAVLVLTAVGVGLSGLHLAALGLVGQYVWRALDEARRRPPYVIEAVVGGETGSDFTKMEKSDPV